MRLGIFFQGVLGLNSCTDNLSDPNAAIENCLCGLQKTPLVHLAALKGDVDLIQKIRDEKICDLGISSSTGNNALIFAAQSSSPFQVSKLLLESGVKKEQSNLNGITPLHALLSQNSKVNDIDELLNTITEYRFHGFNAESITRPVFHLTLVPGLLRVTVPNYFVSYSPFDYLKKNMKFNDREKERIMTAVRKPLNDVLITVNERTRDELISSFEKKRLKEIEKRQKDLDELRDEFEQKNLEFEKKSVLLEKSLEESKDLHLTAQAQIDDLKTKYLAEVESHEASQNSLVSNLAHKTDEVEKLKEDIETKINEHKIEWGIERKALVEKLLEAEKSLNAAKSDIQKLESAYETKSAADDTDSLKVALKAAEVETEQLKRELSEYEEKAYDHEGELSQSRIDIQIAKVENDENLDTMKKEHEKSLLKIKHDADGRESEFENQIEKKNLEIENYITQLKNIEAKLNETLVVASEVTNLKNEIENLGKTVAAEKAVDQLYIEQLESQLDDKTKEIDNFQVENELLAAKASDCQKNLEETTVIDENSKIEELNSDNIEDQTVEKPESAQKIDPDN